MAHDDCDTLRYDSALRQNVPFTLSARSLGEMTPGFLKTRAAWAFILIFIVRWSLGHFADDRYTMMWEVSDGTRTGHVLGTIHVGKEGFFPLDPAIEQAFDRARVISFEIKPGGSEPESPSPTPPNRDMGREREVLYRVAALQIRRDPEAWRIYRSKSIPDRMAEAYRRSLPWTEKANLINAGHIDRAVMGLAGYSFGFGIDDYLLDRAGSTKPILAAEPASLHEEHGRIINKEADFVFDPFDPETLDKAIDEAREVADWVWNEWRAGRVEALNSADSDYNIMVRRNLAMESTFRGLLRLSDRPFMAVGAGHLGGQEGLIALLKSSGLSVKRVRKTAPSDTARMRGSR